MITLLSIILSVISLAQEPIVIMDTGLNNPGAYNLCPTGHYDFVANKAQVGKDPVNHGTTVATILKDIPNTCLIIFKVYDKNDSGYFSRLPAVFARLKETKAKYVNISIVGYGYDKKEYKALKELQSVKFYVAAGNDSKDLDVQCDVYPTCYSLPNIIPVSLKKSYANKGVIVKHYYPTEYKNRSGTSFAAPQQLRKDYEDKLTASKLNKYRQIGLQPKIPGGIGDDSQLFIY